MRIREISIGDNFVLPASGIGRRVGARPVGVLVLEDKAGQDEKVVAVPSHGLDVARSRWT